MDRSPHRARPQQAAPPWLPLCLVGCVWLSATLRAQDATAPADPGTQSSATSPQSPPVPNVLDGLESLKIARDQDFGAPIIDAQDLYDGKAPPVAPSRTSNIPGLDPNLAIPDLTAPDQQPALAAPSLSAPNESAPRFDVPETFGPTMGLSTIDAETAAGPFFLNRPLGAIASPGFLKSQRSFALGGSRIRYGVALDTAVAYNNNVFGTPSNQKGDTIFSLQPTIYLATGKKGSIQFLWTPTYQQYSKYKQFNSLNQSFAFSSRYRWTKLRVGLDASYLAQSGLFLNSQGQARQKAVYARLFAGYSLTKKTELLFNLDLSGTESSPGGRQFSGTFTTGVDYKYSSKTTFGAAVALAYFASSGGTTTSESFLLRLLYNPTSKLVFRGEGGLQFRQTSFSGGSSSAVSSVMNLSLTYRPTSKTYVSLRFFRNVEMDAFSAGNLQITTALSGELSWNISRSLTLDAAAVAGQVENLGTNGSQTGTYNFVAANVAVSYFLSNDVNLKLFNNLQQQTGNTDGNNYISNTSGMALGLRF